MDLVLTLLAITATSLCYLVAPKPQIGNSFPGSNIELWLVVGTLVDQSCSFPSRGNEQQWQKHDDFPARPPRSSLFVLHHALSVYLLRATSTDEDTASIHGILRYDAFFFLCRALKYPGSGTTSKIDNLRWSYISSGTTNVL